MFLRDIWPSPAEVHEVIDASIDAEMFASRYADVFAGDETWQSLPTPVGDTFAWDAGLHLRAQATVLRRHGAPSPSR